MPTATAKPSDTFSALVAPLLDEELEVLQTFLPGGRWKSPFRRHARRLIGRGRLDDGLPTLALLTVTATRVSVRGVAYGYDLPGGMQILEPLGDWPRDQVTGTVRSLTMSVLKDDAWSLPGATHDLDVRRATR